MSEEITLFAQWCQIGMEVLGIGIIVFTAVLATVETVLKRVRRQDEMQALQELRQRVARGILLGLEFLIGADIIHTVAVELTLESVGILAAVVAIRTFLSFTLEVELTGNWPWQTKKD